MQKATLEVTNPREVELTLTCSASVRVWELLLGRLAAGRKADHNIYVDKIEDAIRDAVRTVNKDFVGMASEDEPAA